MNQENKEYMKNKMVEELNNDVLPTVQAFSEVLTENETEILKSLEPVINTYSNLIGKIVSVCVRPASKEYVRSLIESVAELEEHGFTREEAIRLLGR